MQKNPKRTSDIETEDQLLVMGNQREPRCSGRYFLVWFTGTDTIKGTVFSLFLSPLCVIGRNARRDVSAQRELHLHQWSDHSTSEPQNGRAQLTETRDRHYSWRQ